MKAVTYEIERWIEVRLQRANAWHADRWYIVNALTEDKPWSEYLNESRQWALTCPKFFNTPEQAESFWGENPVTINTDKVKIGAATAAILGATVMRSKNAPACGIDCEGWGGCRRDYPSPDECFKAGRKWPRD